MPKDSSIIELTKKLYKDFNIEDVSTVSVHHNENIGYSYQQGYKIVYDQKEVEDNGIETVLHEFAHHIVDNLFSLKDKHGAFFTTVLKWLFVHYEIMDKVYFDVGNELVANGKIKFLDDALIEIKKLSKVELDYILENKEIKRKSRFNTSHKYEYIDYNKNEKQVIIQNTVTGCGVITIRKLFGYELKEKLIKNTNSDDLLGFSIISPKKIKKEAP